MSLITPYLYLGDMYDAQNLTFLHLKKINLIVNCAKELPNYFESTGEFEYINLNLDDIPSQKIQNILEPISNKIIETMKNGKVVFVHCAAGISRSSSVVIYTLMKLHHWGLEKSYNFVKSLHSRTNPNSGFMKQLNEMYLQGNVLGLQKIKGNPSKNFEIVESNTLQEKSGVKNTNVRPEIKYTNAAKEYKGFGYLPLSDSELEDKDKTNKGWSKLTLDCEDCDRPSYMPSGRNIYARIFS
jgi:protein-tyrosine phosphatase